MHISAELYEIKDADSLKYYFLYRRWKLSGPELSRIIHEFEYQFLSGQDPDNPRNFQNHEAS